MSKEYAERLKQSAKELIDGIGTDTEEEQRTITIIYSFIRSGFMKSRSERRCGMIDMSKGVEYNRRTIN